MSEADLRHFLHARIDEIEHGATRAGGEAWKFFGIDSVSGGMIYDETRTVASVSWDAERPTRGITRYQPAFRADAVGEHIERMSPDRALRLGRFLRTLLTGHQLITEVSMPGAVTWTPYQQHCTCNPYKEWPCITLRQLATVWSDHENFDEGWRV